MASVSFDSRTNSTLFTDCCRCAILDWQKECPCCGEKVDMTPEERWFTAMRKMYSPEELKELRKRMYRD